MKKDTNDLFNELGQDCKIENYLNDNTSSFVTHSINEFWEDACERSGLSKSNIINKSDFSYCYFYDVINGRKIPGSDKIIRLILTMKLSLDDCQQALRMSGKTALYPRIKRDSILIFAINNGLSVYQCNDLLAKCNEEPLK